MTNAESLVQDPGEPAADLRIGAPERESAREALEEHLEAERLDQTELERRLAACEAARTWSELCQVFADLPAPHPDLPVVPAPAAEADDDISLLGWAVGVALILGLPVTVVLGFVYGLWWLLAVPVGVSVALLYIEHRLDRARDRPPPSG